MLRFAARARFLQPPRRGSAVINAGQLHWDVQAPPADWATVRDRWQVAHAIRTLAAVLALVLLARADPARGSRGEIPG